MIQRATAIQIDVGKTTALWRRQKMRADDAWAQLTGRDRSGVTWLQVFDLMVGLMTIDEMWRAYAIGEMHKMAA